VTTSFPKKTAPSQERLWPLCCRHLSVVVSAMLHRSVRLTSSVSAQLVCDAWAAIP
jgi:hypothetical protein